METTIPRSTMALGGEEPQTVMIPENSHAARHVVIIDGTSEGTFTEDMLDKTVWSSRYATLYHFNRSPWVEHDYVGPIASVTLHASGKVPKADWVIELLDSSDEPGAIGYHEGHARVSKGGPSGAHAKRGKAMHPETGDEVVLMKVFVKTAREDGAPVTEVLTHELFEAAVDPFVDNEDELRVYPNPIDGKEYIAEVGDPVQERAWDVGAPEGRPCGVPEALISDFAYPKWWGQDQRREATCFTGDVEQWEEGEGLPDYPPIAEFEVAEGGYMSVREPGGEWEQIYGSNRAKAEANEHAFEKPGDVT